MLVVSTVVSVAVLCLAGAVGVDIANVVPVSVRVIVTVLGATLIPGAPIVVALRIPGRALSSALMVSISMAVTTLASQFTMVLGMWHPLRTQVVLAAGALLMTVLARRSLPNTYESPSSPNLRVWQLSSGRTAMFGALSVALVAFVVAARRLDYLASGALGIITQVGVVYISGLVLLCSVLAYALTRKHIDHVVMAASTALLITYSTLLVTIASGQTSIPTAFVHRGFISTLVQSGQLPAAVDARYSWAGFFSAGAHMVVNAEIGDSTPFMTWAPLFFGVVLSFPLYAIAIAITGRVRVAWLSVVLYHLFNWYQQDYFAPQAVASVYYCTILATLFWQLRRAPLPRIMPGVRAFVVNAPRRTLGRVPGFGPVRTLAVGAVLVLLIAANTVTHQITPILVVVALVTFALVGATRYRTLWLAAGLIFATWFSYGATDFWTGHLASLVSEVGQVGQAVGRGVGDRLTGDPVYQKMQYLRIAASASLAVMACAGWFLSRGRRSWLVSGLLCAAPFSLVVMQSYGGEMIIRCFLLASPLLAPLAAVALAVGAHILRPTRGGKALRIRSFQTCYLAVALVGLGILLTTNRGLNTAFEASTNEEVVVTDKFVAEVPGDVTILSFGDAPHAVGPRLTLDPSAPKLIHADSYDCLGDLTACVITGQPAYIYITSQGMGTFELTYGMSPDEVRRELAALVESGRYVPVVDKDSIEILRRFDAPELRMEFS